MDLFDRLNNPEFFNRREFPDSLLRGFLISPERAWFSVLKKFVVVGALTD